MENGLHLRLRIYVSEETAAGVRSAVYAAAIPYLAQFADGPRAHTNDHRISEVSYEPELDRYGGSRAMAVAEEHFYTSSACVLSLLRTEGHLSYEDRLNRGIVLALAFFHGLGIGPQERHVLLQKYLSEWVWSAVRIAGTSRDETLAVFRASYQRQRAAIQPFVAALEESLAGGEVFAEQWLQEWIEGNRHTAAQLQPLIKRPLMLEICRSYLHMTFNRLGINNRDEGFIAYLINESLPASN